MGEAGQGCHDIGDRVRRPSLREVIWKKAAPLIRSLFDGFPANWGRVNVLINCLGKGKQFWLKFLHGFVYIRFNSVNYIDPIKTDVLYKVYSVRTDSGDRKKNNWNFVVC